VGSSGFRILNGNVQNERAWNINICTAAINSKQLEQTPPTLNLSSPRSFQPKRIQDVSGELYGGNLLAAFGGHDM